MWLVKWGFVTLLVLPLAEAAAFMVVGLVFGWLWAAGLCVATSVMGAMLLRRSGRADLDQFLAALRRDGVRAIHLENPGLAALLRGILLVFPGFITDAVGALLFLPAFRRWARAKISHAGPKRRGTHNTRTVIDLPPAEWHQLPDPPPKQRRPRKHPS